MPIIVDANPADLTYHQATGEIYFGTVLLGKGHAGNGAGLNEPSQQEVHNIGPLPRGRYTINPEASSNQLGIVAMRLDPAAGNQMFGRSGFFIHAPAFSEGCIVQELEIRCSIAEQVRRGRNQLDVV